MKKTVSVNLGGSVFNIDEDAYRLLDRYLANLRVHFRNEEGFEEVMNDFEFRISELFSERLRLGYGVITIQHVEEVIARMGKPEEIFEGEKEEPEAESHAQTEEQKGMNAKKRLMRDPDDRILGGVCAGIAAYMGWDATAIRLVFFLLIFLFGYIIPIYILLWIVMPLARTATEKLAMRGKSITIENIGKTVTDSFEKVKDAVGDNGGSGDAKSILRKAADVFVQIVGVLLKIILVACGIIALPVLCLVIFVLIVVILSLIVGGTGLLYYLPLYELHLPFWHATQLMTTIGGIAAVLALGIPLAALAYMVCCRFFGWKPMPTGAKWVLLVLWVLALMFFAFCLIHGGYIFMDDGTPFRMWNGVRMPVRYPFF